MSVPHIVVVGSINMDLVARVARLPRAGETVHGDLFQTIPGGKGANQAVAAARLGARVTMIGRVGDDAFGNVLRQSLTQAGVCTDHVLTTANCASGVALISVDASGANSIIVVAGANGMLTPDDVSARSAVIESADAVVVQLEVPVATVAAALQIAGKFGVRTILDPAPAPANGLPDELRSAGLISPNQTEAEAITGIVVSDVASAEKAAQNLRNSGAKEVVIKLGELGALACSADGQFWHCPAVQMPVIDTTAAGDAFTAGLAVGLSEGRTLHEATQMACAAGTLACTKFGAQQAMPSRKEVDELMGRVKGER